MGSMGTSPGGPRNCHGSGHCPSGSGHSSSVLLGNHPGHLGPLGRWDQSMGHKGPWLLGGSPLGIKLDRIGGGSIYIYMCVCVCICSCYDVCCP